MNIAVINIRDLIKYVIALCLLMMIVVVGLKIVKGKEELESDNIIAENKDSSFLYCLEMEVPLMAKEEEEKESKTLGGSYQILGVELEMLQHIEKKSEEEILKEEVAEDIREKEEENKDKTIDISQNLETKVISENNIEASFTNSGNNVQVKNQSKYDINELLNNSNYELKNKNKVIIYHTHTCESYTASEKYPYEMTGSYRTTNLQYTVARVRR